jgi:hypothetical protein
MRWEITKHRVVRAVGISAWVLVASLAAAVRADDVGPTIEVWYGPNQTFGSPGMAQRWVNVLGNVSDPDGISSLTFSLNGGPQQDLSVGPDRRRLWEDGDFNVEIDFADLNDGANNVLITATDRTGRVSTRDVVVNFPSGQLWPLPFAMSTGPTSAICNRSRRSWTASGLWKPTRCARPPWVTIA